MITLYRELTHSDLKGNIEFEGNVRNLYIILCVDKASAKLGLQLPEISYAGFAKEIARVYSACTDYYIDGEDYSSISYEKLTYAFLQYFLEANMKLSEIDCISEYDLTKEVVKYLP